MAQKSKKKNTLVFIIIVVVAVGLLGFNTLAGIISGTGAGSSEKSTRNIALSCTTDMATQFHIHPRLKIVIGGKEQTIPANIGNTLTCLHPLHTHDTTGTLHVESPEQRDFTLSDFFAVWGKPFSRDRVLDCAADAHTGASVRMSVDGSPRTEFENLVLKDKQDIVIECGSFGK